MGWLLRWAHVVSACLWLGGYATFCFLYLPFLQKFPQENIRQLGLLWIRGMTYIGLSTLASGIFLVQHTRGFAAFSTQSAWSLMIIGGACVAVLVMGLGDAWLRPHLKQTSLTDSHYRLRYAGYSIFILLLCAVALMTRAVYVG